MSLDHALRSKLLAVARQSIDAGLAAMRWVAPPKVDSADPLRESRACFVTLRIRGRLRGCCGNLVAAHPLIEEAWRNAWAAAFADPRFPALDMDEWRDGEIHISVLSPLEELTVTDEQDLLQRLRPGVDGLVLERDDNRATFLPDVWSYIPEPSNFVGHLKQKAGWPGDSWSPHIRVWRYTTESFAEPSACRSSAA